MAWKQSKVKGKTIRQTSASRDPATKTEQRAGGKTRGGEFGKGTEHLVAFDTDGETALKY